MKVFKFELGQEAEDIVTGLKGIIIYRVEHITGCDGYGIQPKVDKKGDLPRLEQIDENRVKIVGKGITINTPKKEDKKETKDLPGGPQASAARNRSL